MKPFSRVTATATAMAAIGISIVGIRASVKARAAAETADAASGHYYTDCSTIQHALEAAHLYRIPLPDAAPINDFLASCVRAELLNPAVAVQLKHRNDTREDPIVRVNYAPDPGGDNEMVAALMPWKLPVKVLFIRCKEAEAAAKTAKESEEAITHAVDELTGGPPPACRVSSGP